MAKRTRGMPARRGEQRPLGPFWGKQDPTLWHRRSDQCYADCGLWDCGATEVWSSFFFFSSSSCSFPVGSGGHVVAFPSLHTRDSRWPGALQPEQTVKYACWVYPTNKQKTWLSFQGSCSSKTSTVKGRKNIIFSLQWKMLKPEMCDLHQHLQVTKLHKHKRKKGNKTSAERCWQ